MFLKFQVSVLFPHSHIDDSTSNIFSIPGDDGREAGVISEVPAQMVDRALVADRSQDPLMLRASGQGCLILVIIDHFVFSAQVAQLLSQRQWRPGSNLHRRGQSITESMKLVLPYTPRSDPLRTQHSSLYLTICFP